MTRRAYLMLKAINAGVDVLRANDAARAAGVAHPEWDMSEDRSWAEWELAYRGERRGVSPR